MYLDKIEIHGFKSFGNATIINIPKGITAIIGPNGSGKSNVADAIRWVLGEQSAKSLRGSKMEDIIFAGTEKRKSLGYAEVAMHIKNNDKQMAIDYHDMIIKRRVYRSGESEYFINGSLCRLKDIQELFMDTGVGREGYSIIGQGQIDRVLSSKPEERRALFEEATGIYKYKIRRLEAERKLEKQRANLIRIQDILSEIDTRLEPLALEAEKTKNYLLFKDQLKEIEVNLFIDEIDELKKILDQLEQDLVSVNQQIEALDLKKETIGEQNHLYKKEKNDLFQSIETLVKQIAEFEKEQEKKRSQIEINIQKIANIEKLIERVEQDNNNGEIEYKNKLEQLNMFKLKQVALEIEKKSQQNIISENTESLERIVQDFSSLEKNMDYSKQTLYEKMRTIDSLKARQHNHKEFEEQQNFRILQIKDHISSLNSEIQHQEIHFKVVDNNKNETETKLKEHKKALEQIQTHKEEILKKKEDQDEVLKMLQQNYIQAQRQLKWLEQMKEEYEGYYTSVKQVFNLVHSDSVKWKGIVGVIGELLEVPTQYELAISTALGSAIQHIVTLTEKDAKAMIVKMKEQGISRVTFLPKDTVSASNAIKDNDLFKEAGVIGLASDLIGYDKNYQNIVCSLLGRIIIVDNMNNASNIAKKFNYKYKLVTLEGEVFHSGGSLSGGKNKNQTQRVFSRNREIKQLQEKIIKYDSQIEELNTILKICNEDLQYVSLEKDKLENKFNELDTQYKEELLESEKLLQCLEINKKNQLQIILEKNEIEERVKKAEIDQEKTKEELALLIGEMSTHQDAIKLLEGKAIQVRREKEHLSEELTQKKINFSKTEQEMIYIEEKIQEIEKGLCDREQKKIDIGKMVESYLEEKQSLLQYNECINNEIILLQEKIHSSQLKRVEYDAKRVLLEEQETQAEQQISSVLEQLDHLKQEGYRLEHKKQNIELQNQNLGNIMWEQYEMTYNHALNYKKRLGTITELRKKTSELKSKIKQIGHINVNAIDEYNDTKTRSEFLNAQKQDIEKAEINLNDLIKNLTTQMEDIFKQQFEQIAIHFTEVFKELFGGGEANLQLSDSQNILESGIEIIVKPPGKKMQNMSLLSGGERTLTAISLLFGILKIKPSPFCVLDEIESALDDANVLRFAAYLDKLSGETQFIVITHRKGTMEKAHTLYGVTMQERGVSIVLSIQLEEITSYLDEKKTS